MDSQNPGISKSLNPGISKYQNLKILESHNLAIWWSGLIFEADVQCILRLIHFSWGSQFKTETIMKIIIVWLCWSNVTFLLVIIDLCVSWFVLIDTHTCHFMLIETFIFFTHVLCFVNWLIYFTHICWIWHNIKKYLDTKFPLQAQPHVKATFALIWCKVCLVFQVWVCSLYNLMFNTL